MNKRDTVEIDTKPYASNDNIYVEYTLDYKGHLIEPGTQLKFKNIQGVFLFKCLAHNSSLDTTWIDCWDADTRSLRAFHLAKLKGVVTIKRSRRKKKNE